LWDYGGFLVLMLGRDKGDRGALLALAIVVAGAIIVAWLGAPSNEIAKSYGLPNSSGGNTSSETVEAVDWGIFTARDTLAQWIAATAAFFSFAASVWAIRLVGKTLKETRRAIHADNRPWLDFEVEPVSDFDRNDTDYYPEGFGVDVLFSNTNHGKSPAVEVLTSVHEVKITTETVIEDFSLDSYRMRLAQQAGKHRRPRSTIFPGKTSEIWNRIVVSNEAIDDAIQRLTHRVGVPEFSLKTRYVVALYYRSTTSAEVHETSAVVYIHMLYGRQRTTGIVFRKGIYFKPIRLNKIRFFNTEQKRTN
jgi:hypothetical protein